MPSILLETSQAWAQDTAANDVLAQWIGDYLYIRTPGWSDRLDAVQRWLIGHKGSFVNIGNSRGGNGCIDFLGEKLVAASLPPDAPLNTLYDGSKEPIRFGGDESIPIRLANGMFLGGGHGFVCRQVTVLGHGLTFADIGKRYINPTAKEYVVADIVDVDHIKIIPKPTGVAGLWVYSNSAVGASLKPAGGGAALVITADMPGQLWPVVQNYAFSARFDDGREIKRGDAVRSGNRVIMAEHYGIGNFIKLYEWLAANAGVFNASSNFGDSAIETQLEMTVTRSIGWTGLAEISVTPHFLQRTTVYEMHAAQTQKPDPTRAPTFIAFVPGTRPLNKRDFAVGSDITVNKGENQFVKSVWEDAQVPPACLAMLAEEGAVTKHGVVTALNRSRGAGLPATQAANIAALGYSLWLSAAEKTYLIPVFSITVEAGTKMESYAYSGSFNPAKFAPADFGYLAPEPGGYVLYVYKVDAAAKQWVPVDRRLLNKPVTLRRATGGGVLLSSTVSERGVLLDFGAKSEIELVISQ